MNYYYLFIELRPCQIRIGFLPIKVFFSIWGIFPPTSIAPSYCKITLQKSQFSTSSLNLVLRYHLVIPRATSGYLDQRQHLAEVTWLFSKILRSIFFKHPKFYNWKGFWNKKIVSLGIRRWHVFFRFLKFFWGAKMGVPPKNLNLFLASVFY